MSETKLIRLINGEEIIASIVSENENTLEIDDAVVLVYTPQEGAKMTAGFAPYMPYAEGNITLYTRTIASVSAVQDNLLAEFNRIFSKIQVASPSVLAGLQ